MGNTECRLAVTRRRRESTTWGRGHVGPSDVLLLISCSLSWWWVQKRLFLLLFLKLEIDTWTFSPTNNKNVKNNHNAHTHLNAKISKLMMPVLPDNIF